MQNANLLEIFSLSDLIIIHLGTIFLLSFAFLGHIKKGKHIERQPIYFCSILFIFFFPGIGLFVAVFICLVTHPFFTKRKSGIYDDYESYIEERQEKGTYTKLYTNILQELRKEVSFEPFIDILKGNNENFKKRVIDKLSRESSAHSVRLLKLAINDTLPETRLSASNALIKIEEDINSKIQKALKMTQKRGGAKDFENLADLYQVYASTGLMKKSGFEYFIYLACEAYQKSLDLDQNQINVFIEYVRSLLQLKDYIMASEIIDRAIVIWPNDQQIKLLRAEIYFYLEKFEDVSKLLSGLSAKHSTPQENEVLTFWGEGKKS